MEVDHVDGIYLSVLYVEYKKNEGSRGFILQFVEVCGSANQFILATSPSRPTTRIFTLQLNTCGYSPYVTFSLTRGRVCPLQLMLALASAVILRSEFQGIHDHILLSQIRDSSNLEVQVPAFTRIFRRNRVARLYPQALGSLFFTSYDSQGYGGGIRPRLYTGC
jgi:hypothetical protein